MPSRIVIVDYGMGNLHSVYKKLSKFDCQAVVSDGVTALQTADKIVLPGVGHFGRAMTNLAQRGFLDALDDCVLVRKKPVLGICLGMQLMADRSDEGGGRGLGWIGGEVIKIRTNDPLTFKIPHMGWNQIRLTKPHRLMDGIPEHSEFYFVHSFHFTPADGSDVLNRSTYEEEFVSAVQKDNIMGVQYHPEKSHDFGDRLFNNFVRL